MHTFFSDRAYKVKVKVIAKGRAKTSPKKGIIYQHLVLQDDRGQKMHDTLFGDQVEGYKEAFAYNGEYEIANALIKPCEDQWRSPDVLDFEMNFGRQTVIQPLHPQAGPILPNFQCIASIPKTGNPDDLYDVHGVVLYVEEKERTIVTAYGRESLVREIVIVDHSTEQLLTISAWNDLTRAECNALSCWHEKFLIIGFTAMRFTSHKGFSLATSMSTMSIHDPKGDRACALEEWALHRRVNLSDRQARILDVRNPSQERVIITLDTLQRKRVQNTLQEELHWLKVVVSDACLDKVNAYIGWSNCGKRTDVPLGMAYACSTCSKKDCVSSPRITSNCEVSDGTGTLSITTFTEDSEKLFRTTASDIFRIKHSDDQQAFKAVKEVLNTSHVLIEVGPKTTLSRNNVLQWILKQVVLEEEPAQAKDQGATVTVDTGNTVAPEQPIAAATTLLQSFTPVDPPSSSTIVPRHVSAAMNKNTTAGKAPEVTSSIHEAEACDQQASGFVAKHAHYSPA